MAPIGAPSCDSVAVAKRDLKEGETLDGVGETAYALLENYETSRAQRLLPMGLAEGCKLRRAIPKDRAIGYDDVKVPGGRLSDELRRHQPTRISAESRSQQRAALCGPLSVLVAWCVKRLV